MTDRQTDSRQTDRQTETVAETNKGVVEVLAVRLRTNIHLYIYAESFFLESPLPPPLRLLCCCKKLLLLLCE